MDSEHKNNSQTLIIFPKEKDKTIKIVGKDSVKVSMVGDNTFEITKRLTPMETEALLKDVFGTTDVGVLDCDNMSDEEFYRIIDELNNIPN